MRIALYQSIARSGDPPAQLAALRRVAEEIPGRADLLICPELFMSGYRAGVATLHRLAEPSDGPFAKAASAIAAEAGSSIVYGFPERAGAAVYNSAIAIGADGRTLAVHRKLHLPGVYEKEAFAAGDRLTFLEIGGVKCGLVICYDVEFPETVRALARAGCDLVIVPTALGARWPVVAEKVIPTRAFENGVFIAYVDQAGAENGHRYAGLSCLVGPDGEDRARAGTGEEVIVADIDLADIAKARAAIPYLDELRRDVL